ncbi:MAG: SAM-dependent chlorinase/fluorinase [Bacteroidia bacterium]
MSVITLTTDLGTRDHYVGALKGTLLSLVPGATLVDITHEVSPFNTMEAAFIARGACFKFPAGTVHIIGVDPEGGSRTGIVAMEMEGHYFVAPDNGVLSLVKSEAEADWVQVNLDSLPLNISGRAFLVQNRMAPVAAALAQGKGLGDIGERAAVREYRWGAPTFSENSLRGLILHVDHFGNAITNIHKDEFLSLKGDKSFQIFIRKLRMQRIVGSYADVGKGDALALFGDNGHLEIAIREGSAAQLLGLKAQDMITIEFYG